MKKILYIGLFSVIFANYSAVQSAESIARVPSVQEIQYVQNSLANITQVIGSLQSYLSQFSPYAKAPTPSSSTSSNESTPVAGYGVPGSTQVQLPTGSISNQARSYNPSVAQPVPTKA